jgi:hypothetical protein
MRKISRLPREEATNDDGLNVTGSLPAGSGPTDTDVEGHRAGHGEGEFAPRLPRTGGDLRLPSGGGEATEDDVEGHARLPGTGGDRNTRLPGTGGDLRRPSGGGEVIDDVEG